MGGNGRDGRNRRKEEEEEEKQQKKRERECQGTVHFGEVLYYYGLGMTISCSSQMNCGFRSEFHLMFVLHKGTGNST